MKTDKTKILVIGGGLEGKTVLAHQLMKEKFGDDIILVTPEEAKEQGLSPDDFANIPKMKILAPPVFEESKIYGFEKTGREKRRANERRLKKK